MVKNIGSLDRLLRFVTALALFVYAFYFHSWVALFFALFTLYEVFASWCIIYQLLGKNTCQLSQNVNQQDVFATFLRYALAARFLASVADRMGWWGDKNTPFIIWGNMNNFENYMAVINPFIPTSWIPSIAWGITGIEVIIALLLLFGLFHRTVALSAGFLLLAYSLAMAEAFGLKANFNYAIFTASAAAFLLSTVRPGYFVISK